MTFFESIQTVTRKYAEFNGTASRPEFWWWILFSVLVASVFSVFDIIKIGQNGSVGSILGGIWGIATLLPTLAVTVRRLRHAGYAWTNVFWVLIPIAGVIVLITYLAKPSSHKK